MKALFPQSIGNLEAWANDNDATVGEAQARFAQFVALNVVSASGFHNKVVLKGGNALRFCYHGHRSTIDLDFSARTESLDDVELIRSVIDQSARRLGERHGMRMKVQSVQRKPHPVHGSRPTFLLKLGYVVPSHRWFPSFLVTDVNVSTVVEIEISINDLVCESSELALGPPDAHVMIDVCTLEDILAEKLRAILQQVTRNRYRPQDVYDVAWFYREHAGELDIEKIRSFFIAKCEIRNVPSSRDAFENPELLGRAAVGYAELRADVGDEYIPLADAWAFVLRLVNLLELA